MRRILSSLLLASGIVLVFAGLSSTFDFSVAGMVAAIALIAGLLYAGATWFGAAPMVPRPAGGGTVIVFDRDLNVAAGYNVGTPIVLQFPEPMRPEIEKRCRAALRGESAHFICEHAGRRLVFDASPVQTFGGLVLYGVLIAGAGVPAAVVAREPVATVA